MADKGKRKAAKAERPEVEEFEMEAPVQPVEEAPMPALEESALPAEETRYFIDPQWYDERGLVFSIVAQARLCSSCAKRLGEVVEERYPAIDPKTKRVTFQIRQGRYASNPLPILRDHCSRDREYVTPETPLLEAIFRVFLANGNTPMTLATLREHLLTYLPQMAALRSDFPTPMLERMIRGDRSYGLREHRLPVAV